MDAIAARPASGISKAAGHRLAGRQRGQRGELQQQHADDGDHAHRADVAVLHDFQHPLGGAGAEEAVGRVGQAVQVQAAGESSTRTSPARRRRPAAGRPAQVPRPAAAATPPSSRPTSGKEGHAAGQVGLGRAPVPGSGQDRQESDGGQQPLHGLRLGDVGLVERGHFGEDPLRRPRPGSWPGPRRCPSPSRRSRSSSGSLPSVRVHRRDAPARRCDGRR